MAANSAEVLLLVKERLGLPIDETQHDELIGLYVDEIEQRIKTYINASEIPDALKYTWAAMVASGLSTEQLAVIFPPDASVEEFETTIGDTSVKAVKPVAAPTRPSVSVMVSVVFDYRSELNAFRKLRW